MNAKNPKVVVTSNRPACLKAFVDNWNFPPDSLIIVEDLDEKSEQYRSSHHFSRRDIARDLGLDAIVIPTKSESIRNFGVIKAIELKADVVVMLDDDTAPSEPLVDGHAGVLGTHSEMCWKTIIPSFRTRGLPYLTTLRNYHCVMSVGLCKGDAPLDSLAQLSGSGNRPIMPDCNVYLEHGYYYPIPGLNLAWEVSASSMLYFLPMGSDYGYHRFGDVWMGIMAKRICDHLGFKISCGHPFINHDSSSNAWRNYAAEFPAIQLNEEFWKAIDRIKMKGETTSECMLNIAENLSMPDAHKPYEKKLKIMIPKWVDLVQRKARVAGIELL